MKLGSLKTVQQHGFSMIEVLVSLVILLLGLLGIAGVMVHSQRAEIESYQRVQAVLLLQDMVDRINANRKSATCYAVTDAAAGSPHFGNGSTVTPACTIGTSQEYLRAIQDMNDWNNLLLGAAEKKGSSNVGAMLGARGCVSMDASTTPPTYRVSVAWQGLSDTVEPTSSACGTGLYGSSKKRRVVTTTLRLATLG